MEHHILVNIDSDDTPQRLAYRLLMAVRDVSYAPNSMQAYECTCHLEDVRFTHMDEPGITAIPILAQNPKNGKAVLVWDLGWMDGRPAPGQRDLKLEELRAEASARGES